MNLVVLDKMTMLLNASDQITTRIPNQECGLPAETAASLRHQHQKTFPISIFSKLLSFIENALHNLDQSVTPRALT